MATYYFDIENADGFTPDGTGVQFATDDLARNEALRIALGVASEEVQAASISVKVIVRDEDARVVAVTKLQLDQGPPIA